MLASLKAKLLGNAVKGGGELLEATVREISWEKIQVPNLTMPTWYDESIERANIGITDKRYLFIGKVGNLI